MVDTNVKVMFNGCNRILNAIEILICNLLYFNNMNIQIVVLWVETSGLEERAVFMFRLKFVSEEGTHSDVKTLNLMHE
jgi:hypothetical protein